MCNNAEEMKQTVLPSSFGLIFPDVCDILQQINISVPRLRKQNCCLQQWTVKVSLRDDFKNRVQKYCDFWTIDNIIFAIISKNPRRGYHNCPLSTFHCQLERSDKHPFPKPLRHRGRHPDKSLPLSTCIQRGSQL